ncbi:tetratricopeptide repeat protein [Streptomyces sp. MST-110588]|uniref:tetratricopeptide repeat protein n=1 Tax=Streptomyces sp. MST-110588 TaxID=2833628 RepID=UPI001F5DC55F|nr:tetratricopeptide repeat protein [Streptomyces sp. MST-110588]UNO41443.1 tetratricopeptide repeat protein [Streptomyces sp. MST-110588]
MDRKRLSRQELVRRRRRGGFVGRRAELAAFRANLGLDAEDEAYQFLFHVHGQAGVGKTSLVRQFEQTARECGALTAYVDEAVGTVADAMAAVSAQLARQGTPLKGFDKLLATYRERLHEVESAVADPELTADATAAGTTPPPSTGAMIAAQVGLAGIGLLPGMGAVTGAMDPGHVARGADRLRGLLSARLRSHDDVQLVMSPLEVLTPAFLRDLDGVAAAVPWVALFFDTYERTGPFLDGWLRDILVSERYGTLASEVVVTLAGRTELDRRCWADYLDCIADVPLEPFTAEEARGFLAAREIVDERIVEVILRLSGGLPVLVSTLALNRPSAPEAVDDPSDTAVERFLKWETDPFRREAALAAALPRHLDEDVFRTAVAGAPADGGPGEETSPVDTSELFTWLGTLPFVADRGGRREYHEVVRTAMLRLQRRRSPRTWATRHAHLADAAGRRRTAYEGGRDPEEWWRDERWRQERLEEIYHALCARSATGPVHGALAQALSDVLDAAEYAPGAALRAIAGTLVQAGEDGGSPEVRAWGARLRDALESPHGGPAAVLTTLLAQPGIDTGRQARIHRVRGREHRKAQEWDAAFADFDRCIELDPRDVGAFVGRGLTHRHMQQFERALQDFTRAVAVDPGSRDAVAQRGEANRYLQRHEDALADFDRVLAAHPRLAWVLGSRAASLRCLGRHEEALTALDRAIEIRPGYTWAMGEKSQTYREMGRFGEALDEIDRALRLNPQYLWARVHRSDLLWETGRFEDVLAELDRALALFPDSAVLFLRRGVARRSVGRLDGSRADLDRCAALGWDGAALHIERGTTHLLREDGNRALTDFERALGFLEGPGAPCAVAAGVTLLKASCHRRAGEHRAASAAVDAARGLLAATGPAPVVGLFLRYEAALIKSAAQGIAAATDDWEALVALTDFPDFAERVRYPGRAAYGARVVAQARTAVEPQDSGERHLPLPVQAAVAVVSRCAAGDRAGAEAMTAVLEETGGWESVAVTGSGIRDLALVPGVDAGRLDVLRRRLIRRLEAHEVRDGA